MAEHKPTPTLLIFAGIGAGVLAGALAGLIVAARKKNAAPPDIVETVDEIRAKAERVLRELTDNVAELKEQTQRIADIASATEAP